MYLIVDVLRYNGTKPTSAKLVSVHFADVEHVHDRLVWFVLEISVPKLIEFWPHLFQFLLVGRILSDAK